MFDEKPDDEKVRREEKRELYGNPRLSSKQADEYLAIDTSRKKNVSSERCPKREVVTWDETKGL